METPSRDSSSCKSVLTMWNHSPSRCSKTWKDQITLTSLLGMSTYVLVNGTGQCIYQSIKWMQVSYSEMNTLFKMYIYSSLLQLPHICWDACIGVTEISQFLFALNMNRWTIWKILSMFSLLCFWRHARYLQRLVQKYSLSVQLTANLLMFVLRSQELSLVFEPNKRWQPDE